MKIAIIAGLVTTLCGLGPDEQFDAACQKAAGMTKYACTLTINAEGQKGAGRGAQTVSFKVDKDVAIEIKVGDMTAYRKGETVVYQDPEGAWKKLERQKGKDREKGARKGQVALQLIQGLKLPHETLADAKSLLKDVARAESESAPALYTGELTDEAARSFTTRGRGGQGGELTSTGSAKFWVSAEGSIAKYEVATETKGKMKDRDVSIKATRTFELSDVGTASVELPEDVKKLLTE